MSFLLRSFVQTYRDAFEGLPRAVWLVGTVTFINRAGTMVMPFLSLYVVSWLHLPPAAAGWVLAAFGLGSVVGSFAGGKLSNRFGAQTMQLVTLVISGGGFLALSQLRSFGALVVGVFLVSAIGDAYRPAAMVAAVEAAPLAVKPRALALLRLAAHLGWSVGPAVGGLLAAWDYRLLFLGDGITCWLAALVLWRFAAPESVAPESAALRSAEPAAGDALAQGEPGSPPEVVAAAPALPTAGIWRDGPFLGLLLMAFLLAVVVFQFTGALPLYLHRDYQLSEGAIGLVFGLHSGLIVAFEMVFVHRLQNRQPMAVFGLGCLITCLSFSMLLLGSGFAWAVLVMALWAVGEMLSMPFCNFLVTLRAGDRPGEHLGVYTAAFSCALVVGPPLGLAVYERFGGVGLWLGVGALGPLLWLGSRLLEPHFRRA